MQNNNDNAAPVLAWVPNALPVKGSASERATLARVLVKPFDDPTRAARRNGFRLFSRIGFPSGFRPVRQAWELEKLLSSGFVWIYGPDQNNWHAKTRAKIDSLNAQIREQLELVRELEWACYQHAPEKASDFVNPENK
jgi:hypothetical protein